MIFVQNIDSKERKIW